jgi:polyhydroxybutyrate depolymerase
MRAPVGSLVLSLVVGVAAGCGGAAGGNPDARPGDGGDLGWPIIDPTPDAAVHGGPAFGDGGAPGDGAPPPPCSGKTGVVGRRIITLTSSGLVRTAILQVPQRYLSTQAAMLVLNFHGVTSDAVQEEVLARMNPASEDLGFIVVYPFGFQRSWNAGQCCEPAATYGIDDVQFVRDLIATVAAEYCVDRHRVYATGMSNGGILSHRLGCELADTIAAIAPVAGVFAFPPEECRPSRPVPIIDFHGTADTIVPWDGAQMLNGGTLVSVPDSIAAWRSINACPAASQTIYSAGDATCVSWSGCAQGSEVVLCTIEGGGHTWPGGVPVPALGKTSTDLSASDAMLSFFAAHPLP